MPFLDIAFRAELSRYEDPDFEEYARRNCNEFPESRDVAIKELRQMIYERSECNPRRMDDAYLLRFLRARRFIVPRAHRLMVRYEQFRAKFPNLYKGIDAFRLQYVTGVLEGVLPDTPDHGRILMVRIDRWDPEKVPVIDLMRLSLFMAEIVIMQPKLQILGGTIIFDFDGLRVQHARSFRPILMQMMNLMSSFPANVFAVHVVNNSWTLNSFFQLLKSFIPSAALLGVHLHGHDLASLHKFIDPVWLPPQYGGTCRQVISSELWLSKIFKFKDDYLENELRSLGYKI